MRGRGAFQMAQMKHRDARVFALCKHLRSAIDVLEQIASDPYRPPEKAVAEPVAATVLPPPPQPQPSIRPEKITYTMREASMALGVGRTTLWKAISEGKLAAIKLGSRTLIPADALRAWLNSMPVWRGRHRHKR